MMKKSILLFTACMLTAALTACGSASGDNQTTAQSETAAQTEAPAESEQTAEETQAQTKTQAQTEAAEAVEITSYEDIAQIYQFDLEGVPYALPCTIDDFVNNGCTIDDTYLEEKIEAQTSMSLIPVHPDGDEEKTIYIEVFNDTDQDMTIGECQKVIGVSVDSESNVSFILNSGIDVLAEDTELDDMKAIYGTDSNIFSEDDSSATWNFYKALSSDSDETEIYSMLQPGTDIMRISSNFTMEYIPPEE